MKWQNVPFRLESRLVRAWFRWTGRRPGSDPYLSGDGFRRWATWRFEPETAHRFDALAVTAGSLGFCDGWLLERFLQDVAPTIPVPFRLISHNADPNFTAATLRTLPANVTKLYAMNCLVDDPRVVPLPIGLENARFHYNGVVRDFEGLRRHPKTKKPRILVAFTVGTNARVRGLAWDQLQSLSTVDTVERMNSRAYRKLASGYQFVASPPGNGEDCHRTWEALYLGAIPIVLRSAMTESFLARGLPLWLVDSYEELAKVSEETLDLQYQRLAPGLASPWLWMASWKSLVEGAL